MGTWHQQLGLFLPVLLFSPGCFWIIHMAETLAGFTAGPRGSRAPVGAVGGLDQAQGHQMKGAACCGNAPPAICHVLRNLSFSAHDPQLQALTGPLIKMLSRKGLQEQDALLCVQCPLQPFPVLPGLALTSRGKTRVVPGEQHRHLCDCTCTVFPGCKLPKCKNTQNRGRIASPALGVFPKRAGAQYAATPRETLCMCNAAGDARGEMGTVQSSFGVPTGQAQKGTGLGKGHLHPKPRQHTHSPGSSTNPPKASLASIKRQ